MGTPEYCGAYRIGDVGTFEVDVQISVRHSRYLSQLAEALGEQIYVSYTYPFDIRCDGRSC